MKKYKVILHPDAETDISSAFEWGRRRWGDYGPIRRSTKIILCLMCFFVAKKL